LYRVSSLDPERQAIRWTSKVITPSPSQWLQFWKAMDEVRLWQWRTEYPNPIVCDGTQWGVEVAIGGRGAKSSGSNAYPDGRGTSPPPWKLDPTTSLRSEMFDKYLTAVEALLGGERFR
jgi:hypothetical protein